MFAKESRIRSQTLGTTEDVFLGETSLTLFPPISLYSIFNPLTQLLILHCYHSIAFFGDFNNLFACEQSNCLFFLYASTFFEPLLLVL